MEHDVFPLTPLQPPSQQFVHSQPLAENHHLGLRLFQHLIQERRQLIRLDAEIGLVIEQISAVATHSHVLEANHQSPLIGLGQIVKSPPLLNDAGDGFPVLFVVRHLLRRHRHEQVLVEPLGS